jgi:type II secretory pathway pseudopilin PulG
MYFPVSPIPKKTNGFTLIEVGIAAILMAALTAGALMLAADQLRTSSAQASGSALATLNTAVGAYEAQFSINLANHTAIPIPGYANVANPYAPTTVELFELGFLKTGVPAGVYGISIDTTVTNGTPSGMVWVTKPFTDNLGHPSQDLAGAAMISAGGDAAISTLVSPSIVVGIDGWTATNPVANTAAILAMRNGAGSAAYVRLDGSTPMQGSLSLNGNNLNSVNSLAANTVSTGTANASQANISNAGITNASITNAGITNLSTGNLTSQSLTATNLGDSVFFGTSSLYSDGWNTVIHNRSGALYVQDANGNANPVVASALVTSAGNGVQIGSSFYYGDNTNSAIRQNGTLYVQNQGGTGAASFDAGRVTAEEYLQVNGYANAGWGCAPNGLIGQNGAGSPLFCVNGQWVAGASVSTVAVSSGDWQAAAQVYCPAGYSLTGGSCDMFRNGDGREISPRTCEPNGNGYYCNEGNGGTCIAHAVCAL